MRRACYFLFIAVSLGLFAGCSRDENYPYATETDEPAYQHGKALERQGREQEALSEFLKVIAKRGEDAPESHLEAGVLYEQHIKDPIAAIYHYRKYLELRPNSPQADLVRQRIGACMRDFARTLPGQPVNAGVQADLGEVIRLREENENLKAQLAAMRAGQAAPAPAEENSEPPPENRSASAEPIITRAPLASESEAPPSPPREPTRPGQPSAHKHTVAKGDTLMSISQRYYGTRSKWRDIYAANRDVMKSENDLKIGMELKIP